LIGDRNTLREHVTMHPGTGVGRGETVVGADGFFMVGAHVAHDCLLGERVVMANHATLGGYVVVGDNVIFGGLCGVHQHVRIGRHAFIGGMATVVNDVIPYGSVVGNHARLAGLNIVGLRRRGFTREQIHDLRAAYRGLFAEEGTFNERIADTQEAFPNSPEVLEILNFIREGGSRALCMPRD
jgi:UDP-N-acetylglucosamine acyltransferase